MTTEKLCVCRFCKRAREKRLKFLGMSEVSPGAQSLWVPPEVKLGNVTAFADRDDGTHVDEYHFDIEYRGRTAQLKIIKYPWCSFEWVEDNTGASVERFKKAVDEELSKLPLPNAEQRKDVAVAIKDQVKHTRLRRQSSNGQIYYSGVN
mgnify:CR=1 FL=1